MHVLESAILGFENELDTLRTRSAVVGFDGFKDVIMKIVALDGTNGTQKKYLSGMMDFGRHICARSGQSCAFVLETQELRMGGNAPILSAALGEMGINVTCIGAIGYPEVLELFTGALPKDSELYGVGNPSISNVLEFYDGKVMLSQLEHLNSITWRNVKEIVGLDNLRRIFSDADVVGLMNWSETPNALDIWDGILNEILSGIAGKSGRKLACFDLSDCTRRTDEEITACLQYISRFGKYYDVILSVNENECNRLFRAVSACQSTLREKAETLFARMDVHMLSLHSRTQGIAMDGSGYYEVTNYNVEKPVILVGGGDHFNAGLLSGLMMGLSTPEALAVANGTSSYYVRYGKSPASGELLAYLREWLKESST